MSKQKNDPNRGRLFPYGIEFWSPKKAKHLSLDRFRELAR